ncbi:MAG: hypothetical protein ACF8QF_02045 [Phycisphaerales bacterium]
MDSIIDAIAEDIELLIPIIAIGGGLAFAAFCTFMGAIKSVSRTNQIEKSRREIAAYIAEGSMTPEEGERLMRAGRTPAKDSC